MEEQQNSVLRSYCFATSRCLLRPESRSNMNGVSSRMKANVPKFKGHQECLTSSRVRVNPTITISEKQHLPLKKKDFSPMPSLVHLCLKLKV